MYIVAIAWMFVVVLMAAAEATSPQGTLLGAFFTLLLYGVLPLGLLLYILGTPLRRQRRAEQEAQAFTEPLSTPPDSRSVSAGDTVSPEGKKP
ncbi:MAG: hypothetical protein C4K60_19620 [Ideonella sp. MAG2]|nr:MAG: hypothetical protein C4K60_19620 [Ideonella sp. MAG2]